jgi:hypothetical protein
MKNRTILAAVVSSVLAIGWLPAQEVKPDFSGTWKFNRQKSELRGPTFRQPAGGSWGGGPGGMGGPGMGGPGMGGPGMGGPGMGGPGMGGPPMGGPGGRRPSGTGQGMGDPEMMGVAESLEINHEEPRLIVKIPMKLGEEGQTVQFEHTTDGKKSQNSLPGGIVVKSQTRWKKIRLITKSTSDGPMGPLQVTEERTLSADGKTMTVESSMTMGLMDWERTLVYEKQNAGGDPR